MQRFRLVIGLAIPLMLVPASTALSRPPAPAPNPGQETRPAVGVSAVRPGEQDFDPLTIGANIERQLTEKLDTKYEKMLHEARTRDDQLREHMSLLLEATTVWMGLFALVITALAGVGIREISQLRKERERSEDLRREIDRHIIVHVKQSIETAWGGLDSLFEKLPLVGDQKRLAGSAPDAVSPEDKLSYEETDTLVVLGDKLDALGGADKATIYFNKLAQYWWVVEDWARGAARSKRAIEISPASYLAHVVYAIGIMDRTTRETEMEIKLPLLAQAERLLRTAKQLKPRDDAYIFHKLGWIYDEKGDFESAAAAYRTAIRAPLAPELIGRYKYDLACTLSKAGQLREALEELRPIITQDDNWRLAPSDPDLDNLRNSTAYKVQFEALIEEGRKAAGKNSP